MDFSNVDTIKAFAIVLVGAVLAAIIIYIYDSSVAPSVRKVGL